LRPLAIPTFRRPRGLIAAGAAALLVCVGGAAAVGTVGTVGQASAQTDNLLVNPTPTPTSTSGSWTHPVYFMPLDSNTAIRFGAIHILEQEDPNLQVSLTVPMTTVGFPDTGIDEIEAAIANGATLNVINIMDFDVGLTSGTETAQTEAIAQDAVSQLESIYGWTAAQAWSHLGITLMNGHTDQPSELFEQSDFDNILAFAQANGAALYSFWSVNRDFECPAGVVEPWNPGTCSGITQNPYDFTKIIVQYDG
jgi:hypothetical protein